MSTTVTKKVGMLVVIENLIAGLQKTSAPSGKQVPVLGSFFTFAQLIAKLQTILTVLTAVTTARDALTHAIAAVKVESVADRAFVKALRSALINVFGSDLTSLAACGIVIKPTTKLSAQATAQAVAKRQQIAAQKKAAKVALKAGASTSTATATPEPASNAPAPVVSVVEPVVAAAAVAGK